ncbi:hypothetical protein ACTFIR_003813 [Dictyostelium discoideum]
MQLEITAATGDESQIVIQSNQELQLATEKRSLQSHPTSVRSNPDGSFRISPEPSNDQLLNNQKQCLAFPPPIILPSKENEFIQFEEGFYNTYIPNLRSETWYLMIQAQVPRHKLNYHRCNSDMRMRAFDLDAYFHPSRSDFHELPLTDPKLKNYYILIGEKVSIVKLTFDKIINYFTKDMNSIRTTLVFI